MNPHPTNRRPGATLVELVIVVAMLSIVALVAVPRIGAAADRAATRAAADEVAIAISSAREVAVTRRTFVGVQLDSGGATVLVRAGEQVFLRRNLGRDYRVRLSSTRDSLAYDPRGLGHGAANLRAILRRGAAAETVVVSRLGRVRH